MEHILFWLNENSGFLNFLTVFASLITCLFSFLSAKAAWAQVKEMRKQYEEENRPYIEVEFLYMRRTYYGLRFINHGRCSAQNVKILLDSSFIDSLPEETFAGLLRKQVGKSCVIGVGQYYDLYFGTQQYRNLLDKPPRKNSSITFHINVKFALIILSICLIRNCTSCIFKDPHEPVPAQHRRYLRKCPGHSG